MNRVYPFRRLIAQSLNKIRNNENTIIIIIIIMIVKGVRPNYVCRKGLAVG